MKKGTGNAFDCGDSTSVSQASRLERCTTGFAAAGGGTVCSVAFVELSVAAAGAGTWSLVSSPRTAAIPEIVSKQTQTNRCRWRMSSSRNADARASTHRRKYECRRSEEHTSELN